MSSSVNRSLPDSLDIPFQRIGLIGLGVMGGSVLLALREQNYQGQIHASCRSDRTRQWGEEHGADSVVQNLNELPKDLDLIFLCTPGPELPAISQELLPILSPNCLVSDMASTKANVIPALSSIFSDHDYLSCHPMTGSEKIGIDGADANLYRGKKVILTPHNRRAHNRKEDLANFWLAMESELLELSPRDHDCAVAWVSHMPHLLMAALIQAIENNAGEKSSFLAAGTGLRDISRLAASNPNLWEGIIRENAEPVKKAIKGLQAELDRVHTILSQNDPEQFAYHLENYLKHSRDIHHREKLGK